MLHLELTKLSEAVPKTDDKIFRLIVSNAFLHVGTYLTRAELFRLKLEICSLLNKEEMRSE